MGEEYIIPEAEDSCPTPVIESSWREIHVKLSVLKSRFKSCALQFGKHPLKIDITKQRECNQLADDIIRYEQRVENWPQLSGAALAGEKNFIAAKYMEFIKKQAYYEYILSEKYAKK
jgi:hypothetical protein